MKIFICCAALLALCSARSVKNPAERIVSYYCNTVFQIKCNIYLQVGLITQNGYSAKATPVQTQDGYILQLIRITANLKQHHQSQVESQSGSSSSESNENNSDNRRPAVLLMHGFMSSAEDFVYGGPSQGLAFQLVDQGYDVYLGNSRGSPYGQEHTTLDPKRDAAFWRFWSVFMIFAFSISKILKIRVR